MELVGRDDDVAEVRSRFAMGRRLVTLTGPGGIGKTALARAVLDAGDPPLAARRPVIELSRLDRPAAVHGAIAAGLGSPTFDVLLSTPPDHTAVLLIDNCEHVIDAAADAVARLLDAWRDVRVMATSRSPLGLAGESVIALAPLAIPAVGAVEARIGAVLLFFESARDSGHLMVAGPGWEEIADRALDWALANASWTPAGSAVDA